MAPTAREGNQRAQRALLAAAALTSTVRTSLHARRARTRSGVLSDAQPAARVNTARRYLRAQQPAAVPAASQRAGSPAALSAAQAWLARTLLARQTSTALLATSPWVERPPAQHAQLADPAPTQPVTLLLRAQVAATLSEGSATAPPALPAPLVAAPRMRLLPAAWGRFLSADRRAARLARQVTPVATCAPTT